MYKLMINAWWNTSFQNRHDINSIIGLAIVRYRDYYETNGNYWIFM